MRPTDIARATFLIILTSYATLRAQDAHPFSAVTCTQKTGATLEKAFCDHMVSRMKFYKPQRVASNRSLKDTTIEFAGWAADGKITIASVLVKDPIGKNTVKIIFSRPADIIPAGDEAIMRLSFILARPVTSRNVGWIVMADGSKASGQ